MPEPNVEYHEVRFLPDNIAVEIPHGNTILQAAQKANVYVNSVCGGDGICGKCRVLLKQGEVRSRPTTLLSRQEILQNYVLACESIVIGDVVVEVPEESELDRSTILVGEEAERFTSHAGLLRGEPYPPDPLVKKLFLKLEPPTVENNLADHERIYQAVKQQTGISNMQTGYAVLRQIPSVLRKSNWEVTVTVGSRAETTELVQVEPGDQSGTNYAVAIDVGTTTVVAHLIDLADSRTVDADATYNSQMKHGEDYIHRIMYATAGDGSVDELRKLIVNDINSLIALLVERNNINLTDINAAICAGNTAMTHFLLGLDPEHIRREPYIPSANFVPPLRAAQVGIAINGRGLLYVLPSVAAYVGSDITAGAMFIRLDKSDDLCLFIDVGTNGEVVLGNKDWIICCSASAGPAFEGSGVKYGMRAARGAIERFQIDKNNEPQYETIGDIPPRGICGSGLLDTIAALFEAGILDRTGRLQADPDNKRIQNTDGVLEYVLVRQENAGIDDDIIITQNDITNLLRSKAAIYAAISILVESMGIDIKDVQHIYLAGGFGNYLDIHHAITIGMLPDLPPERIEFVGNTAVSGAKAALLSTSAFRAVEEISRTMTYFDLMGNPKYMDEFISANFIPHTDIEKFPSVAKMVSRT